MLLGELGDAHAPSIAIAAGVHGDEPAGPWAVLSLLEDGLLDPRFSYRIWPCTNPNGQAAGTRETAEGADINRSFSGTGSTSESRSIMSVTHGRHFTLSIDVHEDEDADGFYCYVAAPNARQLGRAAARAVEETGFPLQDLRGFDLGEPGNENPNRECDRGVVFMSADETRYFAGLSYNLFMLERAAENIVTLESPRSRAWGERIAIHRVAIIAAIEHTAMSLSLPTPTRISV